MSTPSPVSDLANVTPDAERFAYVLRLADNAMVLGQRLSEWVRHAPALEEEMALANVALDFVGQARMYYDYAGALEGSGRDQDDLAFHRDVLAYHNVLLVEQPNGHFGDTIVRQVFFEAFYLLQLQGLTKCADPMLAQIAARAEKEAAYHLRHAARWLVRLGDGTEASHARVSESIEGLWQYTGEMFTPDDIDNQATRTFGAPDLPALHVPWLASIDEIFARATLSRPDNDWMAGGGKQGQHSEHLGYLLAEMQFMQRAYPGATW